MNNAEILLINDTITENHIGCTLATESYLNYLNINNLKIKKSIYTNNLNKFYKLDIKNYNLFIINAEGTLHKNNKGKGKYLFEIIKNLIDQNLKVIILNATIDLDDNCIQIISKSTLISVRERKTYRKLLKYTKKDKLFLTGDLIFSYFIAKKIKELIKPNKENKKIFYDSSKIINKETIYKAIDNKDYNYLIPLIKPTKGVIAANPLRSLKYFLLTLISFFIPKKFIKYNSRIFNHKQQTFNIKNGINNLFNSEYIITGRFHITCILIILRKPFLAYEANTYKMVSILDDFKLKRLYSNEPNFKKRNKYLSNDEKKFITNYIKDINIKQKKFFQEISNIEFK